MTPARWRRIEEVFDRAAELAETDREGFVVRECGADARLFAEVTSLLSRLPEAAKSLHDVVEVVASALVGSETARYIGRRLGPYRLVEAIGEGGMGAVYLAERDDAQFSHQVAIKILSRSVGSPQAIARFRDERQILAALEHPNIVRLLDGGSTDDDLPYLVMEHIEGTTITRYAKDQELSVRARVALVRLVCAALQYAHQNLVVHRDIKPSNILVDADGVPKILDFGIAKLIAPVGGFERESRTGTGAAMFTPEYASPEQARGVAVSTATDVYSVGAVLYELVTGQPPHRASGSALECLRVICEVDPARPSAAGPIERRRELAGDLDNIILKAVHKEPSRRYASMGQLSDDLGRFLDGLPVAARTATIGYRTRKFVRRNKAAVIATTLLWIQLVAVTIVLERSARRANDRATQAVAANTVSQRLLARLYQDEGRQRLVNGRPLEAVPYLLEARKAAGEAEAPLRMLFSTAARHLPALLLEHQAIVQSAVFSPDGTRVVTASDDKIARVWDARTGKPLSPSLRHTDIVRSAAFSPDGTRVVTASEDNTARVWDATTGKPFSPPLEHQGIVNSAVFSPDGTRVITASWDNTARIWDATTGMPLVPPLEHTNYVRSAAFSADGTRVVTASFDNTARVWDAATGRLLAPPLEHQRSVLSAAFSPDGTRVVTASFDMTARVWDATTGKPLSLPLEHQGAVYTAVFSPDGTRVVTASDDKTARVWDATTGKSLSAPLEHQRSVWSAAFSPDGMRVVTASNDKTARVWDATTGKPVAPPFEHQDFVWSAVFSPDGTRVLTASKDMTARVWDAAGKHAGVHVLPAKIAIWLELQYDGPGPSATSFSPDGARIITAGIDGTARVWDAITGKPVAPAFEHQCPVWSAAFSPDGTRLVTASSDRTARVWDATTGMPLSPPLQHPKAVYIAAFSPDGARVLTTSVDGTVRVWDATTGKSVGPPLAHQTGVWSVAFAPDGTRVVTVSKDKTARVWDATTGKELAFLLEYRDNVNSIAFSPDGTRVVTASMGMTARIWDAVTGKPVSPWLEHQEPVSGAGFSPDGTRVITVCMDNTVRVWDATTGNPLSPQLEHQGPVTSAAFSSDGTRVVTASMDKTARVWDAATGKPSAPALEHESSVTSAAFSPDGTRVVTVSLDGTARVWDLPFDPGTLADWSAIAARSPYVLVNGVPLRRSSRTAGGSTE